MRVVITPKALKQYNHLSASEQSKIKRNLLALESNSFEGKKLSGSLSSIRSRRAWPYRIFYYVDEKEKKVFVITIAHRQGVYS